MPDDLYHKDILAWSEQQSARLRRVASGERVNDLDWEHVIEEIEGLGASELSAVQSFLRLAILHTWKAAAWPGHPSRPHWENEIEAFIAQAMDHFQPGMRQHLALDTVHQRAFRDLGRLRMDTPPESAVTGTAILFPDDLLDADFSADDLLGRIGPPAAAPTPR